MQGTGHTISGAFKRNAQRSRKRQHVLILGSNFFHIPYLMSTQVRMNFVVLQDETQDALVFVEDVAFSTAEREEKISI
jgi:hypothetical protein